MALIGQSDEDTGQAICAFVTVAEAGTPSRATTWPKEVRAEVAKHIGKFARPRRIIWAGTNCRRHAPARSCAASSATSPKPGRALGDVTTLRDPDVMAELEAKIAEEPDAEDYAAR